MDKPRIKERLSPDSIVDDEGDVRHIDDVDFDAVGYKRFSSNERDDVGPATLDDKGQFYQSIADTEEGTKLPLSLEGSYPSVSLGAYATNLLNALDSYGWMNKRKGLVSSGDGSKIKRYGGEVDVSRRGEDSEKAGDLFFTQAYGEFALLAAGVNPAAIKRDKRLAKEKFLQQYFGNKNKYKREKYRKALEELKNNPSS